MFHCCYNYQGLLERRSPSTAPLAYPAARRAARIGVGAGGREVGRGHAQVCGQGGKEGCLGGAAAVAQLREVLRWGGRVREVLGPLDAQYEKLSSGLETPTDCLIARAKISGSPDSSTQVSEQLPTHPLSSL